MAEEVKHFKLDAVPETWEANSIYFIANGDYADTYVTTETGIPKEVGNSEMITNFIDASQDAITNISEEAYTGTIVWEGDLDPAGTTNHTCQGTHIGNFFAGRINLKYSDAGMANTAITMQLPSGWPTPHVVNGFNGSDIVLLVVIGSIAAGGAATAMGTQRAYLRANTANDGWQIGIYSATSVDAMVAFATAIYWTSAPAGGSEGDGDLSDYYTKTETLNLLDFKLDKDLVTGGVNGGYF